MDFVSLPLVTPPYLRGHHLCFYAEDFLFCFGVIPRGSLGSIMALFWVQYAVLGIEDQAALPLCYLSDPIVDIFTCLVGQDPLTSWKARVPIW